MARSPYGKRFSLREAAEYLDMTRDQLRAVARRRRITFHQDGDGFEQTRPKQDGTIGRYRRGGNYFFYERDLLAYLDRLSLTNKSWAIGGKRATLIGSVRLLDNSSAGDWRPGWTLEFASGHTETVTSAITVRSGGNTTDGRCTIRAAAGAATRPLFTSNQNSAMFTHGSAVTSVTYKGIEARNSNATKTNSAFIQLSVGGGGAAILEDIRITHATNDFKNAVVVSDSGQAVIRRCEFASCAGVGVSIIGSNTVVRVLGSWIYNNAGAGISATATGQNLLVHSCLITGNTGDGITVGGTSSNVSVIQSTVYGNTGDGIEVTNSLGAAGGLTLFNNIVTGNGGYGFNFSGASMTDAGLSVATALTIYNNATYNNTSGATNPSTLTESYLGAITLSGDPFTNAAGGDFTLNSTAGAGAACRASAYPSTIP